MSMKATHDISVRTGTKEDGKGRYRQIGIMLTDDQNGRMSIKLDSLPFSRTNDKGDAECWLTVFERDDRPRDERTQRQPERFDNTAPAATDGAPF